jgi:hypothetical protein
MDLVPKDKTTQIGLLLGSALLGILILKNFEKQLPKNITNALVALVIVGTLYLGLVLHNQSQEGFYQGTTESVATESVTTESLSMDDMMPSLPPTLPPSLPPVMPSLPPVMPTPPPVMPTPPPVMPSESTMMPSESTMMPSESTMMPSGSNPEAEPYNPEYSDYASIEGNVPEVPSSECYPKDILSPEELLPKDAQSQFAENTPSSQGALEDQNYLNAGFHIGVNTVGQSLRNANRQIRSEPPNPQVKVSPWLQSTIEPDINRRSLEINSDQV